MAKKGSKTASECTAPRTAPRVRGRYGPTAGDLEATPVARRGPPTPSRRRVGAPPHAGAARHAGAAAGESESERRSPCFHRDDSRLCSHAVKQVFVQESQLRKSTRPRPALPRSLLNTRGRRRRDVSASARRRGGRPTPSPRRRVGGRVWSSRWVRLLDGVEETRTISRRCHAYVSNS